MKVSIWAMIDSDHSGDWKWRPTLGLRAVQAGQPGPELARIGARLRTLFDQAVEEPLPDRLTRLVARLEKDRP
jgi:hypothetical protein